MLHNLRAEQSVLGTILLDNARFDETVGLVDSQHFSEPLHGRIFDAIKTLIGTGRSVTPIILRDSFPDAPLVEGKTFEAYLNDLTAHAAVEAFNSHGQRIRDLSIQRGLINVSKALEESREQGTSPEEAIKLFFEQVDAIRAGSSSGFRNTASTLGETSLNTINRLCDMMAGKSEISSTKTGLTAFDASMGGFHPGTLVVVGARPGMGKTTLAASVGRSMAVNGGTGVGLFSLEMPEQHLGPRLLADQLYDERLGTAGNIAYQQIIRGSTSPAQAEKLKIAYGDIRHSPLLIDYASRLTVGELCAKVRGMSARCEREYKTRLELIFIDYLKFLAPSSRYRGQMVYELGEITAALKQLAKDANICVVLLVQLNRETEKTEDKRPNLSSLRSSGDIEADADVVLFLYREAYYLKMAGKEAESQHKINDLDIIIAKQRNGPTGTHTVFAEMACSAIRNRPGGDNDLRQSY